MGHAWSQVAALSHQHEKEVWRLEYSLMVLLGARLTLTSVYQSFAFTATRRKLDPNLARKLRAENGAVEDGLIPIPISKMVC